MKGGENQMNSKMYLVVSVVVVLLLVGAGFMVIQNQKSLTQTPQPAATPITGNEKVNVTDEAEDNINPQEGDQAEEVKEFTVESNGLNFTPNMISVNQGDKVRITYKNNMDTHDWTLDEFNVKTKLLNKGQQETVEFNASQTGEFEFYCSVPGHRQSGMKGTLVVE